MSGGGTAGHVYPALAAAAEFGESDDIIFVGTPHGVESRLVPESGLAFRALDARGFDRAKPLTLLTSTARIAATSLKASRWIAEVKPDVVVGFGGYVSIAVGLAAVLRGIPLALHEQNSVPGLANRFLSRWARFVAVTYPSSASMFRHPERTSSPGIPFAEKFSSPIAIPAGARWDFRTTRSCFWPLAAAGERST
jgi:UDP-N-acetylglucosamine--N-acetylmuramyl-(pentapeptide) pyrophosphoryl-undecaprenol N-acetylglucosamine transferase